MRQRRTCTVCRTRCLRMRVHVIVCLCACGNQCTNFTPKLKDFYNNNKVCSKTGEQKATIVFIRSLALSLCIQYRHSKLNAARSCYHRHRAQERERQGAGRRAAGRERLKE
jgi:hypothetical protein